MDPCPSTDSLKELLDAIPPPPTASSLREHVQNCPRCQETLERISKKPELNSFLGRICEGTNADPVVAASAVPRPSLPGYEILEELGRGGMGVVYKARQLGLNRLVALKMVLAGAHASTAELERFRAEGEAVARLQHPHVVQVFDVGEQAGLPYYSLELCEGGSLEMKLRGTPLPPKEAAALVEKLARAVQAAHDRGVIHRDLKPANVLLMADGTPKVTDFGLAKLLDSPRQRTRTGAVMGTPSYMAPEQAGGVTRAVGPAADTYALGAILYELLTGRPPFRGETSIDTLGQVLTEEPVPPSRLNPRVSRDLETVCLKCLQKTPRARYASALELADDLRRFQADEPIRARPVGRLQRAYRWCRRNPRVAVLFSAVFGLLLLLAVGSTVAAVWINAARAEAEREKTDAFTQRDRADRNAEAARTAEKQARENAAVAEKYFKLSVDALDDIIFRGKPVADVAPAAKKPGGPSLADQAKNLLDRIGRDEKYKRSHRERIVAYEHLGDLYFLLGKDTDARDAYERELAAAAALLAEEGSARDARRAVANAHDKLGQVATRTRQHAQAVGHYRQALDVRLESYRREPDDDQLRRDLAVSYNKLGTERLNAGDGVGARDYFEKGLRLVQEQKSGRDGDVFRRDLAFSYGRLGLAAAALRDHAAARRYYLLGLEVVQKRVAEDPANALRQNDLAAAYQRLSSLAVQFEKYTEAEEWGDKVLQSYEQVLAEDPSNLDALRWLAVGYQWIGDARLGAQRFDAARAAYQMTLVMYARLAQRDRASPQPKFDMLIVLSKLALLEAVAEKYADAVKWCDRFEGVCRGLETDGQFSNLFHRNWRRDMTADRAVYVAADGGTGDVAVILKHPPNVAAGVLRLRALELSRRGRFDELAATAEELRRLGPKDARILGAVAHCYCFGVRAAGADPALRKRHTDAALAALREALRLDPALAKKLDEDPILAPLRDLPEFQALSRGH
jgi:tetratricopeptide (TPR) repeat protein